MRTDKEAGQVAGRPTRESTPTAAWLRAGPYLSNRVQTAKPETVSGGMKVLP